MPRSAEAVPLRFGRIELQPQERRLLVDGNPVTIGARAFDLLEALAERPGRLVGKRELMDLVWPGRVVEENNLAAQVSALRKVLGDEVVATIPGRGYRFVAPLAGGQAEADPAPAAPRLRTNLPAWMPALLGRADDLARCGELVDAHPLVSIVGAGGIGKSLLAMHLLGARRERYPQGVCWVELAAVGDAAALPAAVAAALGVEVSRGEPVAALAGALAPLAMLLALDNAEHLLADVAALVQALLAAAPGLHVVVTSQAPLRLAAERVHRVGPLSVPQATPLPAALALQHGAVALFVDRAQAVDSRFVLTDALSAPVADICRELDGLPLAIELAAARAPLLGVEPLRAALHQRLRLLTAGRNRSAPERQRTLRAALEWSHGLLSAAEQRVFRGLAVNAGSASLDFIRHVLADPDAGLDDWAVLDALDALVERSLVAPLPGAASAPRYRLLESPRALALEALAEAGGERATLQRRHAAAMAVLFDAAYETYFSGRIGVDDWHRQIDPDLDNAREALAHARAADDAPTELTIAATLLRALPTAAHAERMALADACQRRLAAPALPLRLRLRVCIELSCIWANPQKQLARQAAERAVELAGGLGDVDADRFMRYHALARAASATAQTGHLPAAERLLAQARALEDPAWPAQRRLWAAEAAQWAARIGYDTEGTLSRGRELVALDRARGSDASTALGNLVDAELAAGEARAAVRSGTDLVAALAGSRHEYSLAFARINLGAAWLALDDTAHARPVLAAAWEVSPAFELAHATACYLALLAALEGRPRAAALLGGYAEAEYAARRETRERNETAALDRSAGLGRAVLGEEAWARFVARGALLRSADVAALAFAADET